MWMLTFNVVLGYQGLLFWDFLWFLFFSIQPTNPISGNTCNAKWKKRGMALYKKIFLIGCISSLLNCFSITKKLRESFPACQTLHDNFLINEISIMCNFATNSNTHVCKFGRTKFDTCTVLISLFILLHVLLSSWCSEWKVQLYFSCVLALNFRVAKNFFTNFFVTWAQKELAYLL